MARLVFLILKPLDVGSERRKPGDWCPEATVWPTLMAEIRQGRVEPLFQEADGSTSPVPYVVKRGWGDMTRGTMIDATSLKPGERRRLLRFRRIEPVLNEPKAEPVSRGRKKTVP